MVNTNVAVHSIHWSSTYARREVSCMQHVEASSAGCLRVCFHLDSRAERGRQCCSIKPSVYGAIVPVRNPMDRPVGLSEQRPISLLCLVRRDREQGLSGGFSRRSRRASARGMRKECCQSFMLARTCRDSYRNNHPAIRFARLSVLLRKV